MKNDFIRWVRVTTIPDYQREIKLSEGALFCEHYFAHFTIALKTLIEIENI